MRKQSLREAILMSEERTEINELLEKGKALRFASRKTRNRWRSAAKKRWAQLK